MSNNINYWNNFYNKNNKEILDCSNFCNFILNFLKENNINNIKNILDAGCGNGRDSFKLCEYYNVTGVDNSGFLPENREHVIFKEDNFITIDKSQFDLVYSRFTLHSITNEEHLKFINSIKSKSYLVIEARSSKGEDDYVHYGKTHYRNYIRLDYIVNLLKDNNFEILYQNEGKDFAIYKNENPICIRIICIKK